MPPKLSMKALLAKRASLAHNQGLDSDLWSEETSSSGNSSESFPVRGVLAPRKVGYSLLVELLHRLDLDSTSWELSWNATVTAYDLFPRTYGSECLRVYRTCVCTSCGVVRSTFSTNLVTLACDHCAEGADSNYAFSLLSCAKYHAILRDIPAASDPELELFQEVLCKTWLHQTQ